MHTAKLLVPKLLTLALTFFLTTLPASTTTADQATDKIKSELLEQLATAQSESEGRKTEAKLWELWFNESPNAEVRALLDAGRERIQAYDYEAAENHLDQVVKAAPEYAEGYNQRAFARFLRENYSESVTDLEKTLELEPDHFGAMTGMYHILRIQNRTSAAMGFLRQAVTIHPWIQERTALPKDMWPEAYKNLHEEGQEI